MKTFLISWKITLKEAVELMLKNDEVDYCTKCTIKPIVKEHLCEECYKEHNEWLRELSESKKEKE